ncbi:single-stranded DNA-binding protein [Planococcus rifietoensis]|uniref:single-stranded DNA-binding protein n=1 Tax=Planococcus rifietoensis TaxID=200991 RepID=UPI003850EBF1
MINRVVLVGRLTKDPDLRYTPSGVAVARFTLAVNRNFTNSAGDKEADFINVTVWRKQAENAANFLKKGHLAGVEGRIQTGSYEGQDGKRVFTTEVVADSVQFLEPRGKSSQRESNTNGGQSNQSNRSQEHSYSGANNGSYSNGSGKFEVSDDDLPF